MRLVAELVSVLVGIVLVTAAVAIGLHLLASPGPAEGPFRERETSWCTCVKEGGK